MSFLRNASSLAVTSALVAVLGLVTSVMLARFLGPEDMGYFSILQRLATVAFVFCLIGSQSASIYRLRNARIEPVAVVTTALAIVAATSLLATAALFGMGGWLAGAVLGGVPLLAYHLALATIPAQTIGRMLASFARGLDHFALSNSYLLAVAGGTCGALAVGFVGFDVGLLGAVTILVAVHVFATSMVIARVLALTGLRFRTSRHELVETLRYGIKSHAQAVLTQLHESIDLLILAALIDAPDRVAFYAVATAIVNRIKILPSSIANALLPHVAGLEPGAAAALTARAARHSFLWLWGVALAVAALTPFVVPWVYGTAFSGSVRPILILLPATVFLSTNALLARYFMAINRQGVVVRTQACSTTLNIALNFALIPVLGVEGAALASLASYATELILITAAFRRSSGTPLRRVFLIDRADLEEYSRRARGLLARRRSGG